MSGFCTIIASTVSKLTQNACEEATYRVCASSELVEISFTKERFGIFNALLQPFIGAFGHVVDATEMLLDI